MALERVVYEWTEGPGEKAAYDPQKPKYSHFTRWYFRLGYLILIIISLELFLSGYT